MLQPDLMNFRYLTHRSLKFKKNSEEAMMIVTKTLQDSPILPTKHGIDVRNLYDRETALINVITLKPGEALKRHITPVDVAFYVISGTGIVEIGEEKLEVSAGTMIESPQKIVHCWYNESEEDLSFLVIKAPKPTAAATYV